MGPAEHRPGLFRRAGCANPPHVLLDCALRHADLQLEQLATNALCSPESILRGHLLDKGDRLGSDPWLGSGASRAPEPEEPKSLSVPPQNRLRLDEQDRVPPGRYDPRQPDEDRPIRAAEFRGLDLPAGDLELLTQDGVLSK